MDKSSFIEYICISRTWKKNIHSVAVSCWIGMCLFVEHVLYFDIIPSEGYNQTERHDIDPLSITDLISRQLHATSTPFVCCHIVRDIFFWVSKRKFHKTTFLLFPFESKGNWKLCQSSTVSKAYTASHFKISNQKTKYIIYFRMLNNLKVFHYYIRSQSHRFLSQGF